MKTQNNKLDFKTNSLAELNDNQLLQIGGGGDSKITFYFITVPNKETVSLVIY